MTAPLTGVVMILTSKNTLGHSFLLMESYDSDEVGEAIDILANYTVSIFRSNTIAIVEDISQTDAQTVANGLGWTYFDRSWLPGEHTKIRFLSASPLLQGRIQIQWWRLTTLEGSVFDLENTETITSPRKTVFAVVPADENDHLMFIASTVANYNNTLEIFELLNRGFVVHRWTATGLIVEPIDVDPGISDIQALSDALGWEVTRIEEFAFEESENDLGNAALEGTVVLLKPVNSRIIMMVEEPILNGPIGLVWQSLSWAS
jgi:hypothetical protein